MNTQFPVVPQTYSAGFFNQLVMQLRAYFGAAVSKDEETPRIVLRSPSGKLFDIEVTDAGALTVTATDKTRA